MPENAAGRAKSNGTKVLQRGSRDYWWTSMNQLTATKMTEQTAAAPIAQMIQVVQSMLTRRSVGNVVV